MTRYLWILGLSLAMAGSASAQAPGDEGAGDAAGRAPRRQPASQDAVGEEEEEEMEQPADDDRGARRRGRDEADGDDDRRGSFGDRGGRFGRGNAMFEAIDADGDGSISSAELRRSAAALKKLDADGDGNITLAEAGSAGGPGMRVGGPFGGGSPEQMVMGMIQQLDRNRDGQIGLDEVDERSLRMLSQFRDMNEDGKLNQQELLAGVQQMQQRMGGGFGNPGGAFGGGGFDPRQMTERLMANDQNGDGKLTEDEVPPQMQRMLSRADENGDGELDAAEIEASTRRMGERFRGGFGRERGGRGEEDAEEDRGSRRRRSDAEE
ncbi:MAG TPA: hypothetical protein VF175_17825 [Lacipirellula sp.]